MKWVLTVIDVKTSAILFGGSSRDLAEVERCAAEAKRLRPSAKVLIRCPTGHITEWSATD